jgi:SAM-dependent methyltransferase
VNGIVRRIRRAVPKPAKAALRRAFEGARPIAKRMQKELELRLPGARDRQCPVCSEYCHRFEPYGVPPRPEASCSSCGALERHRLVSIFFRQQTDLFDGRAKRMLHFAPERCLSSMFDAVPNLDYVTVDIKSPRARVHADITELPFGDDTFDVLYCSHVLEHVVDDRKAMRELRRVLRPDGWALLVVPITADRIDEDPTVTDPKERLRLYGQEDHVRRYGPDFAERLIECGFGVRPIVAPDFMDAKLIARTAVKPNEAIHYCTKG